MGKRREKCRDAGWAVDHDVGASCQLCGLRRAAADEQARHSVRTQSIDRVVGCQVTQVVTGEDNASGVVCCDGTGECASFIDPG